MDNQKKKIVISDETKSGIEPNFFQFFFQNKNKNHWHKLLLALNFLTQEKCQKLTHIIYTESN